MIKQSLFDGIDKRIVRDKEDGDYAYFQALSLKLEYVTKIVTSGVIACIGEDVDRHRVLLQGSVVEGGGLPTKGRLRSSVQLHQRASIKYVACLIHV